VVYDDDTAEVGNEQAFKEVLRMREQQVLTLEKELEILRRFASSENRGPDTVAELKRVAGEVPSIREDDRPYPDRGNLSSSRWGSPLIHSSGDKNHIAKKLAAPSSWRQTIVN